MNAAMVKDILWFAKLSYRGTSGAPCVGRLAGAGSLQYCREPRSAERGGCPDASRCERGRRRTAGEAAPVNDGAPGGAEQSEVAAAVAEARAEGEKQRVGDGEDDFDDVRAEIDAHGEDPPVHLSAAKEKRLEKRGLKKPVRF